MLYWGSNGDLLLRREFCWPILLVFYLFIDIVLAVCVQKVYNMENINFTELAAMSQDKLEYKYYRMHRIDFMKYLINIFLA